VQSRSYICILVAMSEAPLVTPLLSLSNLNAMAYKLVVVIVTIVVVYYKTVFAFASVFF